MTVELVGPTCQWEDEPCSKPVWDHKLLLCSGHARLLALTSGYRTTIDDLEELWSLPSA